MQFVKHLVHDVVLWTLLVICILNLPYANYAENIVSFYGIFLLVLGFFCIFAVSTVAKSISDEKNFKPRGKLYQAYVGITTVCEIAIVAALGWWWVTAGFTLFSLVIYTTRQKANELYEVKHGTV